MFLGFRPRGLSDGFLMVNKEPYRLYLDVRSRDFSYNFIHTVVSPHALGLFEFGQ